MKIVRLLTVFVCAQLIWGAVPDNYMKWLKIEFNQTGNTCKNPYARVRAVSRYETMADFGCDLQRTIYGGFVNVRAFFKAPTSQNYRQLADVKNIEPCKVLASRKWFPPLNYYFDRARKKYPQFVHDCPYSEFRVYNVSFDYFKEITEEDKKWFIYPNGVYRLHLKVWDDTGDEGHIMIWIEAKFRHRTLTPPEWLLSGFNLN